MPIALRDRLNDQWRTFSMAMSISGGTEILYENDNQNASFQVDKAPMIPVRFPKELGSH
jgi:hypothetical protein